MIDKRKPKLVRDFVEILEIDDNLSVEDFIEALKKHKEALLKEHPEAADIEVASDTYEFEDSDGHTYNHEGPIKIWFTRSETEKELKARIRKEEYLEKYRQRAKKKSEEKERKAYLKLKEKYENK